MLITIAYIIRFRKLKEFFLTLPKHIFITLLVLVASVLFGWFTAGLKGQSVTLNMILEFGTFGISLVTFLLIIFYSHQDRKMFNLFFYSLSLPAIYTLFVFFPFLAQGIFVANDNNFLGLTSNVNIISKILLIPSMLFISLLLCIISDLWR